jgi:hypothetical protein
MDRRWRKAFQLTKDVFGTGAILVGIAAFVVANISAQPKRTTLIASIGVYGFMVVAVFAVNLRRARSFLEREDAQKTRIIQIHKALKEGHHLLGQPPRRDASPPLVEGWLQDVKQWEEMTHSLLTAFSEGSALRFRDDAGLGDKWYSNAPQGDTQHWLRILNRRLENLTKIRERAETYLI